MLVSWMTNSFPCQILQFHHCFVDSCLDDHYKAVLVLLLLPDLVVVAVDQVGGDDDERK